jgi:hypothetical protein
MLAVSWGWARFTRISRTVVTDVAHWSARSSASSRWRHALAAGVWQTVCRTAGVHGKTRTVPGTPWGSMSWRRWHTPRCNGNWATATRCSHAVCQGEPRQLRRSSMTAPRGAAWDRPATMARKPFRRRHGDRGGARRLPPESGAPPPHARDRGVLWRLAADAYRARAAPEATRRQSRRLWSASVCPSRLGATLNSSRP